jgi:hypothetical protein
MTYQLIGVFQYNLEAVEYRGNDDQQFQDGKIPPDATPVRSVIISRATISCAVHTEDRTKMD